MAGDSKIEWTNKTWNSAVGCSVVSPGCTNCYAMRMAARLQAMERAGSIDENGYAVRGAGPLDHYRGITKPSKAGPVWTGKINLAPEWTLTAPLRWRKPAMIFVNSMSDLFHEDVLELWIDFVFAVAALSPHHTFQILTKRSRRMREYLSSPNRAASIYNDACVLGVNHGLNVALIGSPEHEPFAPPGPRVHLGRWPLPNVWIGVSAEDQQRADERIPDLLESPAAIRWVSAEPLLGPLDLRSPSAHWQASDSSPGLDWIVVGGESGPGARPMHPDWARSIRDQCAAAGVAFHFKQWGEWAPAGEGPSEFLVADGTVFRSEDHHIAFAGHMKHGGAFIPATRLKRVGKVRAGRFLDGRLHDEFPRVA